MALLNGNYMFNIKAEGYEDIIRPFVLKDDDMPFST